MFNLQNFIKKTEKEFEKEYARVFISVGYAEECKQFLHSVIENAVKEAVRLTFNCETKTLKEEIDNLIAEEMNIANQEGQPTSRLTSLAMKISKLLE